jgi:hypothetical protein
MWPRLASRSLAPLRSLRSYGFVGVPLSPRGT